MADVLQSWKEVADYDVPSKISGGPGTDRISTRRKGMTQFPSWSTDSAAVDQHANTGKPLPFS